jgi:hypothetical protein
MREAMPEQRKTNGKKISLHPFDFEEALKGLLATEPPKEKKDKPAPKRRSCSTNKKTED